MESKYHKTIIQKLNSDESRQYIRTVDVEEGLERIVYVHKKSYQQYYIYISTKYLFKKQIDQIKNEVKKHDVKGAIILCSDKIRGIDSLFYDNIKNKMLCFIPSFTDETINVIIGILKYLDYNGNFEKANTEQKVLNEVNKYNSLKNSIEDLHIKYNQLIENIKNTTPSYNYTDEKTYENMNNHEEFTNTVHMFQVLDEPQLTKEEQHKLTEMKFQKKIETANQETPEGYIMRYKILKTLMSLYYSKFKEVELVLMQTLKHGLTAYNLCFDDFEEAQEDGIECNCNVCVARKAIQKKYVEEKNSTQ